MSTTPSALASFEGYLPGGGAAKSTLGLAWAVLVPLAVVVALMSTGMPKGIMHWLVAGTLTLVALGFLVNLFTVQV